MTLSAAVPAIDLSACDREPIHIPGHVQAHGVLLALEPRTFAILQASTSSAEHLGRSAEELLGRDVRTLLTPEARTALEAALAQELADGVIQALPPHTATGVTGALQGAVHRFEGTTILELEPGADEGAAAADLVALVRRLLARLAPVRDVTAACEVLVQEVRALTGFDRVMAYRFREDYSGEVIAEAKAPAQEAYVGLRYPATDIPVQARRLYLKSILRLIPDAERPVAALVPAIHPGTGRPLDLTHAHLRAVSPVHLEYMRNMGVRASMSISLVRDGTLWGLIACHHRAPHRVPLAVRTACELVGHLAATQLAEKEEDELLAARVATRDVIARLVEAMLHQGIMPGLLDRSPSLFDLVEADGVAVLIGGAWRAAGFAPDEEVGRALVRWLGASADADVFATESLGRLNPDFAPLAREMSGLLAMRVAPHAADYVLWFRREVAQTVDWAGNPAKPAECADGDGHLSPRRSFALWREVVRGTSCPWSPVDREAAERLRDGILRVVRHRADELAALNAELARSNVELDAFAYVASHDLKEPLRGIHNYAQFLVEDYGAQLDEEGRRKLGTMVRLTRRMDALIDSLLHFSQVGRAELVREPLDLHAIVLEVLDLLHPRLTETGTHVQVHGPFPPAEGDPVRVREVLGNLVTNAIKYNDKRERRIEIGARPGEPPAVYVRDNGIGIAPAHRERIFQMFKRLHGRDEFGGGTGVGLAIARRLVERHGGRLWVESAPGEGSTFLFTLAPDGAMGAR